MELGDAFVETVEDLRRRCDLRASEYDMVQAAGLIRRLLIDNNSLWDQANREIKSRPTVEWISAHRIVETRPDAQVMTSALALDPVLFRAVVESIEPDKTKRAEIFENPPRSGTFDDFLKWGVIVKRIDDEWKPVSVRELVKHYANREGGVHFGQGKSSHPILEEIREFADEDLRRTILACGRITYRAMEPLAAALLLRDVAWPIGLR